ncbi:MAG: hypothetical protein GY714_12690 [Desulfobacterales bacterium]|nr:hypothetical protein [Desulfobacterales bacterium]
MNYSKFSNWIFKQIKASRRLKPAITTYLIFLMASSRTHTLTAAARFSNSSKSRFHYFLKNNSEIAVYTLSELSKKQARQFSKQIEDYLPATCHGILQFLLTQQSLIDQAYILRILNALIMAKDLLSVTNGQILFYILMIK